MNDINHDDKMKVKRGDEVKCPYCRQEMEPGYIQCRNGAYWSEKKRTLAAIPPLRGKALKLSSNETPFAVSVGAWRCLECKKFSIFRNFNGTEREKQSTFI